MARESSKPIVRQHRVDLAIRVELKYPDRDVFVERFAQNVSRTGLFVRAKDPPAVGSRVRFEYKLADGTRLLRGVGIVRWARAAAMAKEPDQPAGMGIEFVDLDADSEELIGRIVARHGEGERAPRRALAAARPAMGAGLGRPRAAARPLDREEETALDSLLEGLGLAEALPSRTPAAAAGAAVESEADAPSAPASPELEAAPAAFDESENGAAAGLAETASPESDDAAAAFAETASPESDDAAAASAETASPESDDAAAAFAEAASPESDDAATAFAETASPESDDAATAFAETASPESDDAAAKIAEATSSRSDATATAFAGGVTSGSDDAAAAALAGDASSGSDDATVTGFAGRASREGIATAEGFADGASPERVAAAEAFAAVAPVPPAPPRLLAPTGEELREPEDRVRSTLSSGGAPVAGAELVADLSSSAWRVAVVPPGGAFADVGDAVDPVAGAGDAQALPSPFDWLVVPWPAPRARVLARRLGLELVDDESGFPAVRWRGLDLSSAALLQLGLEKLLGAVSPRVPPRNARIVLPAAASDAARRLLLRRLSGLGVTRCAVTTAPAAVLACVPDGGATPALVIEVLRLEARLALVGAGGELLAARGCLDAGYDAADAAVGAALARMAGIRLTASGGDAELLAAVRTARRAAPAGPWLFAAGGDEHAIETETIAAVVRAGYEALALVADDLLRGNDLDAEGVRMVVAPEEPLWPDLAGTLAEVLGARAIQLEPDPWIRLRGLSPA